MKSINDRRSAHDGTPSDESVCLELVSLAKEYRGSTAVADVSLTIPAGEFFAIIGSSGCGKSTTLRLIAGLDEPTSGSVRLFGRDITSVPAHKRPIHTVFQSFALFPHLRVLDNVMFGLREAKVSKTEQHSRAMDMLRLVRMDHRANAKPSELSGGQQQRVALARALVLRPQVLLFDEPFAALDRKLREEMQLMIKDLQHQLGTTFVFVTHDQEEAFSMADRVALMRDGHVEQVGTPAELYATPASDFVADFVGVANRIPAVVTEGDGSTYVVSVEGRQAPLRTHGVPGIPVGSTAVLVVRPEDLDIEAARDHTPLLTGTLTDTAFLGPTIRARVRVEGIGEVRISLSNRHQVDAIPRGDAAAAKVTVVVDDSRTWLVPPPADG